MLCAPLTCLRDPTCPPMLLMSIINYELILWPLGDGHLWQQKNCPIFLNLSSRDMSEFQIVHIEKNPYPAGVRIGVTWWVCYLLDIGDYTTLIILLLDVKPLRFSSASLALSHWIICLEWSIHYHLESLQENNNYKRNNN